MLYFLCNTTNSQANEPQESITAVHGSSFAHFAVTTLPDTACSDPGFVEADHERAIKFCAVCLSKDIDDDSAKDLSTGAFYDVFDTREDAWLVRLRTTFEASEAKDNPLEWVPRKHFSECTYPIHTDCSCGKGVWEPPILEHFEHGSSHESPEASIPQVRDWLDLCDRGDVACQLNSSMTFPRRLIEVGSRDSSQVRLCSGQGLPATERYIALSYRWGDTASLAYITTTLNLEQRRHGFALDSLPRTIRDAITLTRWLGVRFIWIDALCINQSSRDDWIEEGSRMDQIYRKAYLTISADSAPSVDSGLLHRRDSLAYQSCFHPQLVQPYDQPTASFSSEESRVPVAQKPRAICCGIANAKVAIEHSILNERGWILQERLLSRRILHVGEFEMAWECNEIIASERMPLAVGPNRAWFQASMAWEPTGPRPFLKFKEMLFNTTFDLDRAPKHRKRDRIETWHDLVKDFCSRKLTVPTDRIPAILGIANAYRQPRDGDADFGKPLFGMWRPTLEYDICWMSDADDAEPAVRVPGVPSFSWASVTGRVTFHSEWDLQQYGTEIEFLEHEAENGETEVVHFTILGPSLKIRGFTFPMKGLVQRDRDPMTSNGTTSAVHLDIPRANEILDQAICLCIGLDRPLDSVDVTDIPIKTFGLLLTLGDRGKPATRNRKPIFYRRIGFYYGHVLDVDLRKMQKTVVEIV